MELNREQIIQGLRDNDSPYKSDQDNIKAAIALIRELTEENERLQAKVGQREITIKDLRSRNHEFTRANMSLSRYADELQLELAECGQIKADTVRKMQERLKSCFEDDVKYDGFRIAIWIDQIAKEMLEES